MLLIHDLTKDLEKSILPCLDDNTKIFSKEISNIHPCMGCFNCWVKTPGKCIIEDDYTEMPKYILENNQFVIISNIKYGCYSPYIKNVLDRSIGFLLPFFRIVEGNIHHSMRYDNIPEMIFIAYGDDITSEEKETFKDLIHANSINFGCDKFKVFFAENTEDIKSFLIDLKEN